MLQDRITEARTAVGSQPDAAPKLGVSIKTISRYENGKGVPDAVYLRRLADRSNVSVDWLLCRTDEKKPAPKEQGRAKIEIDTDTAKPVRPSMQTSDMPEGTIHPGYAFGTPGHYQLIIDFYVIGSDERTTLPFGPRNAEDSDMDGEGS